MVGSGWIIIGLCILLAGLAAFLFVPLLVDSALGVRRLVMIRGSLMGDSQSSFFELLLGDLCTNGVALTRLPARYLGMLSAFVKVADNAFFMLATRIPGCKQRAISETLVLLCLLCGLAIFVLTQQFLVALVALLLPLALVHTQAQKYKRERQSLLREQLPDALRGLGMCFMAGLSLEQAFAQTAQECQEPLQREMQKAVDDLHTGSSVMESLARLDNRLAMDEMRFVSVALEIQHRTGGSMREVLDCAADSMLASFDLSRSLEVQTAQAKMSARIVSMLPVGLVVVLSLTMEGYLASFFSSAAGFALLLCAVAMQVAGIFAIRKILGIDLG
ncbi:MAG: type II secretion system F family protein [Coriobacteriia bacterium]|nr:type II secretion system F family protein [Coriobacteriia bacterium]